MTAAKTCNTHRSYKGAQPIKITGQTAPHSQNCKNKDPDIVSISESLGWQGQKDSNPQQRFWRPTCYHYTMPLHFERVIV